MLPLKAKQKRLLVNAGLTDQTLQDKTRSVCTQTHTPRILDSYQGDLEIRKLKSLFLLSHSTCFLSKQTAGGSTAFRSLFMKYSDILYGTHTHTQAHTFFFKTWQAQPRLTNSNKITLLAKFSSCKLKTLWTAGGPHQTPPESMYKLSHIWICRWPEGIDKECQSKPPLSLHSLCYSDQTVGWLVVPLQLGMTDEMRDKTHACTHIVDAHRCTCSTIAFTSHRNAFFAHTYPHSLSTVLWVTLWLHVLVLSCHNHCSLLSKKDKVSSELRFVLASHHFWQSNKATSSQEGLFLLFSCFIL